MAPLSPHTNSNVFSSAPLADYFFIAGIESSQIFEKRGHSATAGPTSPPVRATIQEDAPLETSLNSRPQSSVGKQGVTFAFDKRQSTGSYSDIDKSNTASNRSSATIRVVQNTLNSQGLSEADFDLALHKFAAERDSFLEEIQFNAGAVASSNRQRARQKTHRIINDDLGYRNSTVGSLRKRLSAINSLKRQPSSARQASIRSKRLSGYNSVIPSPQPFQTCPNMHPLKRRYEPVMLDRYPPPSMVDELKRRNPFPDYVPMFAFPNDVSVVSSDERPRSTWHGFTMTNSDNSKLYGICLLMWLPLNAAAAGELENQCDAWRKANMSQEERELASSLGERLAGERAKLSRLLAKLPTIMSGTEERELLEDEISAVEEKIWLMTDLLRPVRHGAASKIDGLTENDTGLWIPRAYGILGRDESMTSFWKEWLRAIAVPMTQGAIQRVPASSPKIGMWQPLERYVVNLCAEALSPISSATQVEIAIREMRMYARKEAVNEIPGSRNVDLYPLFRCLTLPNIITLFEYILTESRIILLSSHTSMLHLAVSAITHLLYPLKWASVLIPVLPARLIQALDAPCPYIVGIERRYESLEYPEDDFVLVDLDHDSIESTGPPISLPKQQRRKLMSLLQTAAPHHSRFGVPTGPPAYAIESFPFDAFVSENSPIFNHRPHPSTLATLVGLNSTSFADMASFGSNRLQIFNAFLQSRANSSYRQDSPSTASISKNSTAPPSPKDSPVSLNFPPLPTTPVSRNDSGYSLQANLREKRSGFFDNASKRSSSYAFERVPTLRRPSQLFTGHSSITSTSVVVNDNAPASYAPSIYAQSTLAASTIMPGAMVQPTKNTETTCWTEGHCLQWTQYDEKVTCSICDDKTDDGFYRCNGCGLCAHGRCAQSIALPCPAAFKPEQIRAAFVRCFASLFYTYRRFLPNASAEQKKSGLIYSFKMDGFLKSIPTENAEYMKMLQQTQTFNEFIHERETKRPEDPSIMLFDQVILAKKNRGKSSIFSKSNTNFLADTSEHIWRSAAATPPNARFPGDYRQVVSRIPAKLDPALLKEPRVIQGIPRIQQARAKRKPIPSILGLNGTLARAPTS